MANSSIKLIAAQEKHIKLLQDRLKEMKREQMLRLSSTPGWVLFILKHTPPFVRRSYDAQTFMGWASQCKFEFNVSEENNAIRITCKAGSKEFTSGSINTDEFDEFIEDSIYEKLKTDTRSWYWSSSSDAGNNSCAIYYIPDMDKFMNGQNGEYIKYFEING